MTKFVKKDQITSSWYEIDATNAVVGRLATVISKIIRGKNKALFFPLIILEITVASLPTTALVASISYHDEVIWSFLTNFVIVPGLILLLITKSI